MRAAFILNSAAGQLAAGDRGAECVDELRSFCSARGIEATVEIAEGRQLTSTTRRFAAEGVDVVVAAGGDGTVSAVAAGLVGTEVALGVFPLGTLNHFSRDLGIVGLDAALDAIAMGSTRQVDVGEVNGRVFINNSSLGLYPKFIVERDRERHRTGARRWLFAGLHAARRLLRRDELEVTIAVPGRVIATRTPFVIVGNNRYSRDVRALGKRDSLDSGLLSVYTVHAKSRLQLLKTFVHALDGTRNPPELEEHDVERVVIVSRKRSLTVAVDGEVIRMRSPLVYRIRPAALTVFAPATPERIGTLSNETDRPHLGSALRQAPSADRPRATR